MSSKPPQDAQTAEPTTESGSNPLSQFNLGIVQSGGCSESLSDCGRSMDFDL